MTLSQVLLQELPLAVGAAVSPLVLILQLMLMARPGARLAGAWAFALGNLLVLIGWTVVGRSLGHRLSPRHGSHDPVAAHLEIVLALVLLTLALRAMRTPLASVPQEPKRPPGRHPVLGALGLGLGAMGSNVTTFVLFFPAAQEVGRSALPPGQELLALVLLVVITLAPAWAPPAMVLATGKAGRRVLEQLSGWVGGHRRGINAAVALFFALLLGIRGFSSL
ncbi:GAP family protein [Synechococcus sp. FGCU-3]|nr:GAP family protein [Synechococcus sp. FGCU3]